MNIPENKVYRGKKMLKRQVQVHQERHTFPKLTFSTFLSKSGKLDAINFLEIFTEFTVNLHLGA